MDVTETLYVRNRAQWRRWLLKHHRSKTEIWLIYYKKHTGKAVISYNDAVEEALCFGWIDGLVKRMDEQCYTQRFTPRRAGSQWSLSNLRRIEKLVAEGKMTEAGMIHADKVLRGEVIAQRPPARKELPLPKDLQMALRKNNKAWANFETLPAGSRRSYIIWVTNAKKAETRAGRIVEAVGLVAE